VLGEPFGFLGKGRQLPIRRPQVGIVLSLPDWLVFGPLDSLETVDKTPLNYLRRNHFDALDARMQNVLEVYEQSL
jgi:hypothetical protein